MAIKLRNVQTGKEYIFLGVGFGVYKSASTGNFAQNFFPETEAGDFRMIAMCDKNGIIRWGKSDDFQVVEVNGSSPKELLP